MTIVDVVHFTDAGCPRCYSAEPVRIALEERYGGQLRWRDVQVGVHESAAAMAEEGYTTPASPRATARSTNATACPSASGSGRG